MMKAWSALLLMMAGTSVPAVAAAPVVKRPTASVHSAAKAAPLPVFSFLGDDTETVTQRKSLNSSACTASGPILTCDDYGYPKLAGAQLKWLSMSYNQGRLYRVLGSMGPFALDTVLAAFNEKYGTPTVETRKWQSKGGAVFDNHVAIWHFKGGTLELESMGTDVNSSNFAFVSEANAPPKEKPKVDF